MSGHQCGEHRGPTSDASSGDQRGHGDLQVSHGVAEKATEVRTGNGGNDDAHHHATDAPDYAQRA